MCFLPWPAGTTESSHDGARPVGRRRRDGPGAGLRAGRAGRATAVIPARPSSCSTSPRTRPSWSATRTPGHPCCACTGSATTPSRRSPRSWPGWTRCGRRPGCARRGCCRPPTGGGWSPCHEAGGAAERYCVRFEFLPGTEPGAGPADDPGLTGAHFAELGEITARMHRHAREWSRPAWFTRFHWDYPAAFGGQARWGRWQDGIGVGPAEREILTRLDDVLRARLLVVRLRAGPVRAGARRHPAGQPAGARRLGQRHRLRRRRVQLVPVRPGHDGELLRARAGGAGPGGQLARGLPEGGRLSAADEAEIWTFIMFRRLLLVAWIGSHRAVDIAAELGAGYTQGSCDLAESYLSTH